MPLLSALLVLGLVIVSICWGALTLHILLVARRRDRSRALLASVVSALESADVRGLTPSEQVARVRTLLDRMTRELVMHALASGDIPPSAVPALTTFLRDRWDERLLLANAGSHRSRRDKWRRMAALRIVCQLQHPQAMDLIERAVGERDEHVASVALSLLGRSPDPRAIDILLAALRGGLQPASRVAAHLEHSPQPIVGRLRVLLHDADPMVRAWVATLLGRSAEAALLEQDMIELAGDGDPRVRKAAIQALGRIGGRLATNAALRLLTDPVPYVRGHAARAIAEQDRIDLAPDVATLLGDSDWWVRHAAKESLETLGTEVWPVLVRCLEHEDRFVQNGAAEVIQNLGVLDTLIVLEAASDQPSEKKIHLLRLIASAGGARLTDSLLERTGPTLGPRMRHLLSTLGLERVGAA